MRVIATVLIAHPAGLTVGLALAGLVVAALRLFRPADGDAFPASRRQYPRMARAARGLALLATIAVVGTLLAYSDRPGAHVLLGMLAVAAGAGLAIELYRREPAVLSRLRRSALIVVRLCAWTVMLTLVARPACERVEVAWEKPVLAVLLDDSASMAIADPSERFGPRKTRAQRANAAISQARSTINRLRDLYDVRLRRIGPRPEPASVWEIIPEAPLTGLVAALRDARELRSARGRPPAAILIISDGAENVRDAAAVRQAADDLAGEKVPLLAVGVGPEPGQTPLVELEPLQVPPRVGLRDLLHVTTGGRVAGCRGQTLPVEVLWDDEVVTSTTLRADYDSEQIAPAFDVLPPGPGAHRLTVRVALPAALGGQRFTTSAVVDVAGDRVRVLYVEDAPHTESAFITRVWRGDPNLDVSHEVLFEPGGERNAINLAGLWSDYDVVVLGRVRPALTASAVTALTEAVTERGVGLLLAGGQDLLNSGEYTQTALADVSPTRLTRGTVGGDDETRFVPTDAGLQHPVLEQVASRDFGSDARPQVEGPATSAEQRGVWLQLPSLREAATLGEPKPAAVVLAVSENGRPLLAAQEVGRGRCLAAAWESTWPWALASEEGHAVHRRLWRQMAVWLANRRPRAWVLTDQPEYTLAALSSGERRVRIRAGVSGLTASPSGVTREPMQATLTWHREASPASSGPTISDTSVGDPSGAVPVKLERSGDVWTAELPDAAGHTAALAEGTYVMEFSAQATTGGTKTSTRPAAGSSPETLTARTRFVVVAEDVEQRPPTANLTLLRTAAERTSAAGGRYTDISALPQVLDELAQKDERQRVETLVRYDVVEREPWGLLAWLVAALVVEWVLRKRAGLA